MQNGNDKMHSNPPSLPPMTDRAFAASAPRFGPVVSALAIVLPMGRLVPLSRGGAA